MTIAIHDFENDRVIIAAVPDYLTVTGADADKIAEAVLAGLGLSGSNCSYMLGKLDVRIDLETINADYGKVLHRLDGLTQDFKEDAIAALREAMELDA